MESAAMTWEIYHQLDRHRVGPCRFVRAADRESVQRLDCAVSRDDDLDSVTGFPLPSFGFDPPRAIGIISIVLLALAVAALYAFHLAGSWRWIYIVFVGVMQAQKLAFWQPLTPTQSEPPFVAAQLAVLAAFVVLGVQRGG